MKWFAKRTALRIAVLFLLLLTAAIAVIILQPDDLAAYKAELAAQGEELSLTKLAPPITVEADRYHRQFNDIVAQLSGGPIAVGGIGLMDRTNAQQPQAQAAWRGATPENPARGTWEDFAAQIDQVEPALAELRELLANPPEGSAYDPTRPFNRAAIDFVSKRRASQALAGVVVLELNRGRLSAALTNLNALIAMGRNRDRGGFLVEHMIHVAISGLAISATWEALQAPGWTDAQLTALKTAWQSVDLARGFSRTMELERAFALSYFDLFRTNTTERRQIFGLSGQAGPAVRETLYESLFLPIWSKTWSKGDERRFLERMQPILDGIRRAEKDGAYPNYRSVVRKHLVESRRPDSALDRFRFPIATSVMPNWEKATHTILRTETLREMLLTALALKRWQLRHGLLPNTLDKLVPEFLPTLPIDYLNGGQITFERRSDSQFVLRSVGQGEAGMNLVWPELKAPAPNDN